MLNGRQALRGLLHVPFKILSERTRSRILARATHIEWTVSGFDFDRLPGMLLFKHFGALVTEPRMKALGIADVFDEARQ